jgi:hypothetical protein
MTLRVLLAAAAAVSATSVEPKLISTTRAKGRGTAAGSFARPQAGPPGENSPFTIAVVPDPQKYADSDTNFAYQQRWHAQTEWIRSNQATNNIVFVSVLGDVVQNFAQSGQEWLIARGAVSRLHLNGDPNASSITPWGYSIAIGNHDYDSKQWTGYHPQTGVITNIVLGSSKWRQNYGLQFYADKGYDWFGGSDHGFVYDQPIHGQPGPWVGTGLNRFQYFHGGGREFLHVALELGAPDYAIAWADQIITEHPGTPTVISTHALIDGAGQFLDVYGMWRQDVGNSGQQIWDKLLKRRSEIFLVLCGHAGEQRNVTLPNDFGDDVYIMLTDYVTRKLSGESINGVGWLRLLTLDPVSGTLRARTYSPILDEYAGNFGGSPTSAYPPAAVGDAFNGTLSDFELPLDWRVRFPAPRVAAYCTAGTSSNGCAPAITCAGIPSTSASAGFTLTVDSVEGQKQGMIVYGVDNAGWTPVPWSSTSTSYRCVRPPTQRTGTLDSGGASGQCDGVLTLDWNAYRSSHPEAIGEPFGAGQHVYAQAWFRDPPAPMTTNLSNGLDFVVEP